MIGKSATFMGDQDAGRTHAARAIREITGVSRAPRGVTDRLQVHVRRLAS